MRNPFRFPLFLAALAGLMVLVGAMNAIAAGEYPLREQFPKLSPIETEELAALYGKAIIIDTRNKVEFDVIQITDAKNILVGKMTEQDLLTLRPKDGDMPLVFYCNGKTCMKSYKAAEKATEWGFKSVRVYDPGIFEWSQKQPEKAKFFGQALTAETVKTSLIGKEEFEKACLATADFIAKTGDAKYTIFDIRDPNERKEKPIRLAKLKVMPMDTFVDLLVKKNEAVPKSGLLFIDNVGKQVDWIQYYLKREGVSDYFFLKGGVDQWTKDGFDPDGKKQ